MMDRRDLLRFFALSSGSAIAGRLAEAAQAGQLLQAREGRAKRSVFNTDQFTAVGIAVELIIPKTDTPGAMEAGVAAWIDQIVTEWYTPAERASFLAGLAALDDSCRQRFSHDFIRCETSQQIEALRLADEQARKLRPPAYENAFAVAAATDAPFFFRLKELTVLGYYTSELGATRELVYSPVPGTYDGDVDFAKLGHQWSS